MPLDAETAPAVPHAPNGQSNGQTSADTVSTVVEMEEPQVVQVQKPSDAQLAAWVKSIPPDERARVKAAIEAELGLSSKVVMKQVETPPIPVAQATAPAPAPAAPAPSPTPAAAPATPAMPDVEAPSNFMDVPEAIFRWTPEISDGRPLCGLLVRGTEHEIDKRDGHVKIIPGRLTFFLFAPSYALKRDGERVLLSAGRYVFCHLYDGLASLTQVANKMGGMVNMRILATGSDPAEHGGVVHHFNVKWEESRENPGQAKLYPRDILKAGQPAQATAGQAGQANAGQAAAKAG